MSTETAATPPAARARDSAATLRAVRTAVVLLALVAAAVFGGGYMARERLAAAAFVDLDNAVLTAEPVPVGTTTAGVVSRVAVSPQNRVASGQELARVAITGPGGEPTTETLKAPITGIVSTVDVANGAVAGAGEAVVTLYDPTRLTFQAEASVEELRRLRLGMAAGIGADGLGTPISARLDRVVPRVGDTVAGTGQGFRVVFVPDSSEVDRVRGLVPGLPFTATVDTKSAVDGTPAVNGAR